MSTIAKRHSDPRYITQALPPLVRLKGKPANATLRLACQLERCQHKGCESFPTHSRTLPGVGKVERLCLDHLVQKNERAATQNELDMILRWTQDRMHNRVA